MLLRRSLKSGNLSNSYLKAGVLGSGKSGQIRLSGQICFRPPQVHNDTTLAVVRDPLVLNVEIDGFVETQHELSDSKAYLMQLITKVDGFTVRYLREKSCILSF